MAKAETALLEKLWKFTIFSFTNVMSGTGMLFRI